MVRLVPEVDEPVVVLDVNLNMGAFVEAAEAAPELAVAKGIAGALLLPPLTSPPPK